MRRCSFRRGNDEKIFSRCEYAVCRDNGLLEEVNVRFVEDGRWREETYTVLNSLADDGDSLIGEVTSQGRGRVDQDGIQGEDGGLAKMSSEDPRSES